MIGNRVKQTAIRASLLAGFACALVAGPASAQWYAGAGLGAAQAKLGNSGTIQGNDSYKTSGKIFGGYQFTPNWGVEAQYVYLGKFDFTNAGRGGSYKPESWGLAATGTMPLAHNLYLMGKLGAAFNRLRDSDLNGDNKTDLLAGVGVGYDFTPNWGIRAEYEDFGKMSKNNNGGDIKGNNWSISVKYTY